MARDWADGQSCCKGFCWCWRELTNAASGLLLLLLLLLLRLLLPQVLQVLLHQGADRRSLSHQKVCR